MNTVITYTFRHLISSHEGRMVLLVGTQNINVNQVRSGGFTGRYFSGVLQTRLIPSIVIRGRRQPSQ